MVASHLLVGQHACIGARLQAHWLLQLQQQQWHTCLAGLSPPCFDNCSHKLCMELLHCVVCNVQVASSYHSLCTTPCIPLSTSPSFTFFAHNPLLTTLKIRMHMTVSTWVTMHVGAERGQRDWSLFPYRDCSRQHYTASLPSPPALSLLPLLSLWPVASDLLASS